MRSADCEFGFFGFKAFSLKRARLCKFRYHKLEMMTGLGEREFISVVMPVYQVANHMVDALLLLN